METDEINNWGVGDWTHWQQEQQRRGRFAGVVVPCACGPSPPARPSSPFSSSSSSSLPRRGRESGIAGAREGAIACGDPIQQNAVGGAEEEDEYACCCCVSTCKWSSGHFDTAKLAIVSWFITAPRSDVSNAVWRNSRALFLSSLDVDRSWRRNRFFGSTSVRAPLVGRVKSRRLVSALPCLSGWINVVGWYSISSSFKVLNCVWFICFGSNWELVIPVSIYVFFCSFGTLFNLLLAFFKDLILKNNNNVALLLQFSGCQWISWDTDAIPPYFY